MKSPFWVQCTENGEERVYKEIWLVFDLITSQALDNQPFNHAEFFTHAVQIFEESALKSVTFYAVGSFVETIKKYGVKTFDKDSLKLWIAVMYMNGMKVKTIQRYVGKLHTIYNAYQKGTENQNDPFVDLQSYLDLSYQVSDENVHYNVEIIKRMFGKNESSKEWPSIAMFFYLLYNANTTMLDMVNTTFDNAPQYCSQVVEIVKSCDKSNGQKYLFKLEQRQIRPTQISKRVTADLTAVMTGIGMKYLQGPIREEITALWVYIALKCGIDICDIRAIIPAVPYEYRALMLIQKPEISEERQHEIICKVADAINDNTPRWFVMKLRKGVDLDKVKDKTEKELPGRLDSMELFYPTHTTFRDKGGKKVKEETPYVPNLLFFQTQYNKIRSLFAHIGDLAYCLKENNLPDARYSVIPQEEMTKFMKCVGQFTDDVRMQLVDANRGLRKGRMVRITGGMMKGFKGKIEDINDDKGTRTFFLQVTNEKALKWTVEVEDVFIEPLNQ